MFEDQPFPKQMPTRVARTKTDAFDEEYTAGKNKFHKMNIMNSEFIIILYLFFIRLFAFCCTRCRFKVCYTSKQR